MVSSTTALDAMFETFGEIRISARTMTPAESEEAIKLMPDWRRADSEEIAVMKETDINVIRKMYPPYNWILTGEKGLLRGGPCRLDLRTGKRTRLCRPWEVWGKLQEERTYEIRKEFLDLPARERAYVDCGSGYVGVQLMGYVAPFDEGDGLLVGARGSSYDRGWIVLVKGSKHDVIAQLANTLRKETVNNSRMCWDFPQ
jgi:hypothetical protein